MGDGREIRRPVLFVDLPVLRQGMEVSRRGDPVDVHAVFLEKVEKILEERPGVDIAAAEFELGHPDGPHFKHPPSAQQEIHLVPLYIGLEQMYMLHAAASSNCPLYRS